MLTPMIRTTMEDLVNDMLCGATAPLVRVSPPPAAVPPRRRRRERPTPKASLDPVSPVRDIALGEPHARRASVPHNAATPSAMDPPATPNGKRDSLRSHSHLRRGSLPTPMGLKRAETGLSSTKSQGSSPPRSHGASFHSAGDSLRLTPPDSCRSSREQASSGSPTNVSAELRRTQSDKPNGGLERSLHLKAAAHALMVTLPKRPTRSNSSLSNRDQLRTSPAISSSRVTRDRREVTRQQAFSVSSTSASAEPRRRSQSEEPRGKRTGHLKAATHALIGTLPKQKPTFLDVVAMLKWEHHERLEIQRYRRADR